MADRQNRDVQPRTSWRARRRYWIDNFMTRGVGSILRALTLVFLGLLVVLGVLRAISVRIHSGPVERGRGFLRQIWITWLEMTDPGTQAYDIDSSGWFKVFAVVAAVVGIVMLSTLIALLTAALESKLRDLRSGRSQIVESGHTVVLGWNDRIVRVIRELIEANESEPSAVVAVLAQLDKEEMDRFLELQIPPGERATTRIVTRSGLPSDPTVLKTVSPRTAKSVIALCPDPWTGRSDLDVVKAALATVVESPESTLPIVAEVSGPENLDILSDVAPDRVLPVHADDILAKIMVQCSRTQGLALVYQEILSFEGAELYFHNDHNAGGLLFGDLVYHLEDGIPVGLRRSDGALELNPLMSATVAQDDDLLVLAQDDSTIAWSDVTLRQRQDPSIPDLSGERNVEQVLVMGWSRKGSIVVRQFDEYLAPGSIIDVVSRRGSDIDEEIRRLNEQLVETNVTTVDIDPHSRSEVESLGVSGYGTILLLAEGRNGTVNGEDTDSDTLTMLLRVRRQLLGLTPGNAVGRSEPSARSQGSSAPGTAWSEGTGERSPRAQVISEVLNPANAELVVQAGVNDVLVSNSLVSSIAAQLSEQPDMARVYEHLFAEDGPEIYLKPADWYFESLPVEVDFWEMIERAHQRNEQALGYRLVREHTSSLAENFGIHLDPPKDRPVLLTEMDRLVVLSEDEL